MARIAFFRSEHTEDDRPLGHVSWADPSRSPDAAMVTTFNPPEYHSPDMGPERDGVRSNCSNIPWAATRNADEQLRRMNRLKGFDEDGD